MTQPILSGFYALCPLGLFIAVGGFLTAGFEAGGLIRYARGWRPADPSLVSTPEEGPSLPRHLAKHATNPVVLEEGRRYRTVDPERMHAALKAEIAMVRGIACFCAPIGLALFVLMFGARRMA